LNYDLADVLAWLAAVAFILTGATLLHDDLNLGVTLFALGAVLGFVVSPYYHRKSQMAHRDKSAGVGGGA
jgi:hypothetical protein